MKTKLKDSNIEYNEKQKKNANRRNMQKESIQKIKTKVKKVSRKK